MRHTRTMVSRGVFAHVVGRSTLVSRVRAVRYVPSRRWRVGENLGMGHRAVGTPRALVRA